MAYYSQNYIGILGSALKWSQNHMVPFVLSLFLSHIVHDNNYYCITVQVNVERVATRMISK